MRRTVAPAPLQNPPARLPASSRSRGCQATRWQRAPPCAWAPERRAPDVAQLCAPPRASAAAWRAPAGTGAPSCVKQAAQPPLSPASSHPACVVLHDGMQESAHRRSPGAHGQEQTHLRLVQEAGVPELKVLESSGGHQEVHGALKGRHVISAPAAKQRVDASWQSARVQPKLAAGSTCWWAACHPRALRRLERAHHLAALAPDST